MPAEALQHEDGLGPKEHVRADIPIICPHTPPTTIISRKKNSSPSVVIDDCGGFAGHLAMHQPGAYALEAGPREAIQHMIIRKLGAAAGGGLCLRRDPLSSSSADEFNRTSGSNFGRRLARTMTFYIWYGNGVSSCRTLAHMSSRWHR